MQEGNWHFDNSYLQLPKIFYTEQNPVPVRVPHPVLLNHALAKELNIPLQTEVLAGNIVPLGAKPLAQAYAGHQFGHFTMLGDGRAILLGEIIAKSGERFDLQLKGAGQTPYSRGGDGRAALAPMLREYIISEAMHALGIPTTRSLAVVTTGEQLLRERILPGAVLTRVASSHIRVGTFSFAAYFGSVFDLRALADYTIARHFPHIADSENKCLCLLHEAIKQQAKLLAQWQLVGFVHGVMNTDNMSICGETIDYGPCAFMDVYDPATVFSSIDRQERYSYQNQPKMAIWNLARLAESLLPLLHADERTAAKWGQEALDGFDRLYESHWLAGMRAKLGLLDEKVEDAQLIQDLLRLMQTYRADYTNTFRALSLDESGEGELFAAKEFHGWQARWQARLYGQPQSKDVIKKRMKSANPAIIPRNHRVEEALEAAETGDVTKTHALLHALENPYAYTAEQEEYAKLPKNTACPYRTFCGT